MKREHLLLIGMVFLWAVWAHLAAQSAAAGGGAIP